jgi:hypothetical protein
VGTSHGDPRDGEPGPGLESAHAQLTETARALAAHASGPGGLHASLSGAIDCAAALASLIAAVERYAPEGLDGCCDRRLVAELQADLHAAHGCLATTGSLLAPARDDLARLLVSAERPTRGDAVGTTTPAFGTAAGGHDPTAPTAGVPSGAVSSHREHDQRSSRDAMSTPGNDPPAGQPGSPHTPGDMG